MSRKHKHDWKYIKEHWITVSLGLPKGAQYSLKQLSEDCGIEYHTLIKKVAKDKWRDIYKKRREGIVEPSVNDFVNTQQQIAIEEVKKDNLNNEVNVRLRHANLGRYMQTLAFQKLKTVKAESLTVKEAIKLLDIGIRNEREALGITTGPVPDIDARIEEFSLADALKVMDDIIPLLKGEDGVYSVEDQEKGEANDKE